MKDDISVALANDISESANVCNVPPCINNRFESLIFNIYIKDCDLFGGFIFDEL